MIKYIMKKYALSERGAKGFIWAVIACAVEGLALVIPVSLLYYLTDDFLKGAVPTSHYYLYGFGIAVALVIVAFSKKAQNHFQRKQNEASVAVQDGIQECLDTVRDLKSNNAEKKYLEGLNKKIRRMEGLHIKSELGSAMFVVPAQMILKLGKAGATDEEVLRVACEAQCDEFVEKLPNGYNTVIGENGSMISGGKRQRISIARYAQRRADSYNGRSHRVARRRKRNRSTTCGVCTYTK